MNDLTGYFKEGQRKMIYNAADNIRDKVLIRLLWMTGRRIGEILSIRVSDIDFDKSSIVTHIEKKTQNKKDEHGNIIRNDNGRPVKIKLDLTDLTEIDDFTKRLIIEYVNRLGLQSNDYLLRSDFKDENKPISRQRADQIIKRLSYSVGIYKVGNKKPHVHNFRHSFAIDMANKMKSPADVRKLQMMMNHSTLAVTETYLKFNREGFKELLNNIGD